MRNSKESMNGRHQKGLNVSQVVTIGKELEGQENVVGELGV